MSFDITVLGQYIRVQGGFAYKSKDFLETGKNKVLKIKNIRFGAIDYSEVAYISDDKAQESINWKVEEGDILISMTGSGPSAPQSLVGRVARVWKGEPNAWINQRVGRICLIDEKDIYADFIFYLLSLPKTQEYLVANSSGSGNQANISGKIIESLPCPKVDYVTSRKIAKLVRVFDEKAIINNKINETLESISQALFKSWFVDFDPVKAKIAVLEAGGSEEESLLAAMQVISSKNAEELAAFKLKKPDEYAQLQATAELFPAAMEESELGEIPEGWEISEIGDEVVTVGGGTPSTKNPDYWEKGNIHWTTPKDLSGLQDKVLIETDRKITERGLAKISSGLLPINTVLMSSRAPVGYLALVKIPVAINQGYIGMKCEKTLTPEYVIQWCVANMGEIKNRASGTTFSEISRKEFKTIPVIVPTRELLAMYSIRAEAAYEKIECNAKESKQLAELRDTLLPKLLSGALQVNDEVI